MYVVQLFSDATPVAGTGQQGEPVPEERIAQPHAELLDRIKTDQKPDTHEVTSQSLRYVFRVRDVKRNRDCWHCTERDSRRARGTGKPHEIDNLMFSSTDTPNLSMPLVPEINNYDAVHIIMHLSSFLINSLWFVVNVREGSGQPCRKDIPGEEGIMLRLIHDSP